MTPVSPTTAATGTTPTAPSATDDPGDAFAGLLAALHLGSGGPGHPPHATHTAPVGPRHPADEQTPPLGATLPVTPPMAAVAHVLTHDTDQVPAPGHPAPTDALVAAATPPTAPVSPLPEVLPGGLATPPTSTAPSAAGPPSDPEPAPVRAPQPGHHAHHLHPAVPPGQQLHDALTRPARGASSFAPGHVAPAAPALPPVPVESTTPGSSPTGTTAVGSAGSATEPALTSTAPPPPTDALPGALTGPGTTDPALPVTTVQAVAGQPTPAPSTTSAGTVGPTHPVRPAIEAAARHLRHEGGRSSLVVRLDPPELGAVLVRLTVRDGQVDVTLRAPDQPSQSGLLAQAPEIQQVLREAGLDLSSFDVSWGDASQAAGQGDGNRGDVAGGSRQDQPAQTPDRGTPRGRAGADGRSDVTDDAPHPQHAGTWL